MCSSMNHLWRTFCSMPIYMVSCRTYCSLHTLPGTHSKARKSYAARRQKRLAASCVENLHITSLHLRALESPLSFMQGMKSVPCLGLGRGGYVDKWRRFNYHN